MNILTKSQEQRLRKKIIRSRISDNEDKISRVSSKRMTTPEDQKWFLDDILEKERQTLYKNEKRLSFMKKTGKKSSIGEREIQYVKTETPIESLLGNPVNHLGDKKWYKCPLHNEKTSSFLWNDDSKYFYCFGCQQGGDIIKLYQLIHKQDFISTVKTLLN